VCPSERRAHPRLPQVLLSCMWQVLLTTEQFQGRNKNKNTVFRKLAKKF